MNKKYFLSIAILALFVTTLGVAGYVSADTGTANNPIHSFTQNIKAKLGYNNQEHAEQKAKMDEIFANKDFAAWQELMADKPMFADKITEETFNKLAEAHSLMQSGDFEGAKQIRDDLGLPAFQKRGQRNFGEHKGDCQYRDAQKQDNES